MRQQEVLIEVITERVRQDERWGEQNHPSVDKVLTEREGGCTPERMCLHYEIPGEDRAKYSTNRSQESGELTWAHIAVEELSEAISAKDDQERRLELVQLAAVVIGWIECLDRRAKPPVQGFIPFTQFLRPDGRQRAEEFPCSPELAKTANDLITAGYIFECEELMNTKVSLTCRHRDNEDHEPVAIELVPNGPAVPVAIQRLVATTLRHHEHS